MKFDSVQLHLGDKELVANLITYDDLVALYWQYIERFGKVPSFHDCLSKNDLPQGRIINRVLRENDITYNEFISQFGLKAHIRTEDIGSYQKHVNRYIEQCYELGRTINGSELHDGKYGLPSASWLVKNCPDKSVTSFAKFVKWCGLRPSKNGWSKEDVSHALIELERSLGRPITRHDISADKTGFSMGIVNKHFGCLGSAKKELGMLPTPPTLPMPFEQYKADLTETVIDFMKKTGRNFISWRDIESGDYGSIYHEHKTYTKAFKRAGIDIFSYIKSLGCMMNPSDSAFTHVFDDGERADSGLEHDLSLYLRSLGYRYNKDYRRFVKYSTFSEDDSKMDCDYVLTVNGHPFYIEVLGFIYRGAGDWHTREYSSERENTYRDKMIRKENLLINAGADYLYLFYDDFASNRYKKLIDAAIEGLSNRAA